jgi:hypothetical protein
VLIYAWQRQLPWPNVIVLFGGTAGYLLLACMGLEHVFENDIPSSGETVKVVLILMSLFLISRLIAQDLWAWRAGRPHYGYEVIGLTGLLFLWQLLFFGSDLGEAQPWSILLLVLLWQVLLTPWLIRKSPAPAPRDWVGPVVWVGWVSWFWYWVNGHWWKLPFLVLPGLLALIPWRRLSGAKAKPGPA